MGDAYLDGLPEAERSRLAPVNAPGLARLGEYLTSGEAVAFVGAGASAPLYPLWSALVDELVDEASSRMTDSVAATCRTLAATSPEEVVELVRQRLRPELYREVLRRVFRVRRDPDTGRTWTATHELVARCNFRGVVTTNYDHQPHRRRGPTRAGRPHDQLGPGGTRNVARWERVLARCDLADGHIEDAEQRLRRAEATFRDGDIVLELAETLVVLAEQPRRAGSLDEAGRACSEAIDIAGPRELVPTHASALAVRARIRADHRTADDLLRARDDADHALRLATKVCQLPWQELDALDSHMHIDRVAGTDGGWAARAATLRATLVPDDLDPDPLATVEAKVAAQREVEDDPGLSVTPSSRGAGSAGRAARRRP
jgi:hypothetical protein